MEKEKNPHKGHRSRVRGRYIKTGLDNFADHEVLELLLYYAYPQKDTNEIAHNMIEQFGSLHKLMESHPKDIMNKCNVTENVAVLVSLTPHLAKRYLQSRWKKRQLLNNTSDLREYASTLFVGANIEQFYVICLDKQRRLIETVKLSEGSIDSTPIYTREIVKICLRVDAKLAAVSHNHPSGDARPSRPDREVTKLLRSALNKIDIKLADHIIVGDGKTYSFRDEKDILID